MKNTPSRKAHPKRSKFDLSALLIRTAFCRTLAKDHLQSFNSADTRYKITSKCFFIKMIKSKERACQLLSAADKPYHQWSGCSNGSYAARTSTPAIPQISVAPPGCYHSVWLRHKCPRRTWAPNLRRWNWI